MRREEESLNFLITLSEAVSSPIEETYKSWLKAQGVAFFFKTQIKTSVQRMTITVAELTVLIVTASVRMMVNHRKFCSSASSQEERNNETVTTPLAEVSCSSSSFLSKSEANFVSPQPRDCHRYFLVPEAIHCQQFGAGATQSVGAALAHGFLALLFHTGKD